MNIAEISQIAFIGARIILFLLTFLSFLSLTFFIERLLFFKLKFEKNIFLLLEKLKGLSSEELRQVLTTSRTEETKVLLESIDDSGKFSQNLFESALLRAKPSWERYSAFLGSVGSNAPFIGLLGTVLGIMKSFADLGINSQGGAKVVMSGISEALVTTAVGLMVAIPSIIFFNICKNIVKHKTDNLTSIFLFLYTNQNK